MSIGPWEIGLIIILFMALPVYFVPIIVAIVRRTKNTLGIVLLNIFGGWTLAGWIIALVWSIVDKKQADNSGNNQQIKA